jgi:hypothetical protein
LSIAHRQARSSPALLVRFTRAVTPIGGRLHVMFDNIVSPISLVRAGQSRALAVSLPTDALPGVPLISDFLPGYEPMPGTAWSRRRTGRTRSLGAMM